MADNTTNLEMPFIMPAQAQKHVTHNEALLRLDAIVHLAIAAELAAPPEEPAEGACYLIAAPASGPWTGKEGQIAARQDGAWNFARPREGWRAWFVSSQTFRIFSGGSWHTIVAQAGDFEQLGINATPDTTNRLALSSPASLFNHAGNSHQVKINKAAAGDTASLLFQSNWTGHAEMGLAGDNAFSIKVSDGTAWRTGLAVSEAGYVSKPNQPTVRAHRAGTSFSPAAGQESGFTVLALNQGEFALGAAAAGGGNRLTIPATGLYLVALNVAVLTSSGHMTSLVLNGSQTLFSLSGASGGAQAQCGTGLFALAAGDNLALRHAGTAQLELGPGKTELSLAMV